MRISVGQALCVFALIVLPLSGSAQIRIGQTAGFTGAAASGVKEITSGAKLYLDSVNAQGGINGQAIELVSLDDKFEPALAAENAKKLAADPKVVALFMTRGTPHALAMLPVLADNRITLIAPSTGAMALHEPVNPWVFNVRATYQKETEHLVRHLGLTGLDRIALIQVNDSFGSDAAEGAMKVFKESGKKPALQITFDRTKPDFATLVPKVLEVKPLSIVIIGTGTAVVDAINALRAAGSRATIATLSPNASSGFVKSLGANAEGLVVSQVFPSARSFKVAMAAEATRLAQAAGIGEVTPQMLEGYAGAKVLVAALRKCGNDISRANIKKQLETFNRVNIGGLEVSFSPTRHTGLEYSDLSIVAPNGSFRR